MARVVQPSGHGTCYSSVARFVASARSPRLVRHSATGANSEPFRTCSPRLSSLTLTQSTASANSKGRAPATALLPARGVLLARPGVRLKLPAAGVGGDANGDG